MLLAKLLGRYYLSKYIATKVWNFCYICTIYFEYFFVLSLFYFCLHFGGILFLCFSLLNFDIHSN